MSRLYQITDGGFSPDAWMTCKERATRRARARSGEEPRAIVRVREHETRDDLSHRAALCAAMSGDLIKVSREVVAFRKRREIAWT